MLQLKVYEVTNNSDMVEGRGYSVHVGYFTKNEYAEKAAKGIGPWGSNANVSPVTLLVFEDYKEYTDLKSEVFRQAALAKLTLAERIALGLEKQ